MLVKGLHHGNSGRYHSPAKVLDDMEAVEHDFSFGE